MFPERRFAYVRPPWLPRADISVNETVLIGALKMPKVADDDKARRAEEKRAQKRARGSIACAECRRLKLKCDRVVPCTSCTRRGCESICPNGQLVHGQGKMLLADTEQLHEKIRVMSGRIRTLEEGLHTLHSRYSRQAHPLLKSELLSIKFTMDIPDTSTPGPSTKETQEDMADTDAFGTLVDRDAGAPAFFGTSAGAENFLSAAGTGFAAEHMENGKSTQKLSEKPTSEAVLAPEIAEMFGVSPLSLSDTSPARRYELMLQKLPQWSRARQLCDIYLSFRTWSFGMVSYQRLNDDLLPLFFTEAALGNRMANRSRSTAMVHHLGLMFAILAIGAFLDTKLPLAPHNEEGTYYFQAAKTAVELAPFLDTAPTVSTIQLVILTAQCHVMSGEDVAVETLWRHTGLAIRLGQSIGLHLDAARWKLAREEIETRRTMFFDMLIEDLWISVGTGRIPCFPNCDYDVKLPDREVALQQDGNVGLDYPLWKARFARDSLSAVGTFLSIGMSKYAAVLELDAKLVNLDLPGWSQGELPEESNLLQTMYYYGPMNCREHARLYLNRRFFAQAIIDDANEPQNSRYGRSFVAAYEGTRAIVSLHAKQCDAFPSEMARLFYAWTNPFCALVMLAAVLMLSPRCSIAEAVMSEIKLGLSIFERGAAHGGRAAALLPTVQMLYRKAVRKYDDRQRGINSPSPPGSPPNEAHIMLGMVSKIPRRSVTGSASPPDPVRSRFSESDVRSQGAPHEPTPPLTPSEGGPEPRYEPVYPPGPSIADVDMGVQPGPSFAQEIFGGGGWNMVATHTDGEMSGYEDWQLNGTDAWSSFVQQLELPQEHQDLLSFSSFEGYF